MDWFLYDRDLSLERIKGINQVLFPLKSLEILPFFDDSGRIEVN